MNKPLIALAFILFNVLTPTVFAGQIAISNDHGQTTLKLAKKYLIGKGVPKDYAKAVELLNQAANEGNVEAIADLGSIYYLGTVAPKNLDKAFKLTNTAAALGYPPAFYTLGEMYRRGEGVQKNKSEAVALFLRAISKGNVYALKSIGHMYRDGEITAAEHNKAAELFQNTSSPNDISTMYYMGRFSEFSGDFHAAVTWFTKANKIKNPDLPESLCAGFHLGTLYMDGNGVEKNQQKANALFDATAKSVIKYNNQFEILDFKVDKINRDDLTQAFIQAATHETTHQYSKDINDSAAKMVNELISLCAYP